MRVRNRPTCTVSSDMPEFSTLSATSAAVRLEEDILTEDLEVGLVRGKSEHDKIGILKEEVSTRCGEVVKVVRQHAPVHR